MLDDGSYGKAGDMIDITEKEKGVQQLLRLRGARRVKANFLLELMIGAHLWKTSPLLRSGMPLSWL
jgi:hypothetical protein